MKMKNAYEQNPALGDPLSVEGQLSENGHKLEKLRAELRKFQTYLAEIDETKPPTPVTHKRSNRNSVSEDSLSRSASDSSVTNQRPSQPQIVNHNNHNNYNNHHNANQNDTIHEANGYVPKRPS